MSEFETGPDEVSAALDEESRDTSEQAWQEWLGSRPDPDAWLAEVYDQAARCVDYLTEVCLNPEVRGILEAWDMGGTELPWTDAGPDSGEKTSSDEEGLPGEGRNAA